MYLLKIRVCEISMAFIPALPILLTKLTQLESGQELIYNLFELFWMFYESSLSPSEFQENLSWWRNRIAGLDPDIEFEDPTIAELMENAFRDSEGAVKAAIERLNALWIQEKLLSIWINK